MTYLYGIFYITLALFVILISAQWSVYRFHCPSQKIQINNSLSKIVFQKIIHNNYIHFNHIYYNLNVIFCLRVLLIHLKKIYTNFSRSSKKSLSEHLDLNQAWLARVSLHHLKAVFGVVFRWLWWSWSWRWCAWNFNNQSWAQ